MQISLSRQAAGTGRRRRRASQDSRNRGPIRFHGANDAEPVGLNVVPLVDVTFLLMIFFVIAGSFQIMEGALHSSMLQSGGQAGAGTGTGTVALPVTPIVVRIMRAGSDDDKCRIQVLPFSSTFSTFSELVEKLTDVRSQPGFDSNSAVVIQADDDVQWDHVVNGWNAALRAGFLNLAYAEPIRADKAIGPDSQAPGNRGE